MESLGEKRNLVRAVAFEQIFDQELYDVGGAIDDMIDCDEYARQAIEEALEDWVTASKESSKRVLPRKKRDRSKPETCRKEQETYSLRR